MRRRSRYGSGSASRAASIGFRQAATGRLASRRTADQSSRKADSLDHHRLGLPPQPPGELGGLEGVEVQPRVAEGGGIGGVGAVGADVLLVGPDLDQLLPQPDVALGLLQPGLDLVAQGLDLAAPGPRPAPAPPGRRATRRDRRPRGAPGRAAPWPRRAPGRTARRAAAAAGAGRSTLSPPTVVSTSSEAASPTWNRRRAARPGALVGLGGGVRGLLGAGGLGGAGDLGGAEAVLHAAQIGRDPLGHGAGVPRAVLRLARQAVPGDRDQLGVGPAGVQAGQGVGQCRPAPPCGGSRRRSGPGRPDRR